MFPPGDGRGEAWGCALCGSSRQGAADNGVDTGSFNTIYLDLIVVLVFDQYLPVGNLLPERVQHRLFLVQLLLARLPLLVPHDLVLLRWVARAVVQRRDAQVLRAIDLAGHARAGAKALKAKLRSSRYRGTAPSVFFHTFFTIWEAQE